MEQTNNEKELSWSFSQIWNRSLEQREESPLTPRNRIYASELGGATVDRYLKMIGEIPTNPPNARSLRKFEAGNIWEAIIGYVLKRAGVFLGGQERLQYQYPKLLAVSGKLDFVAGGKPDYKKALLALDEEFGWFPEFIADATKNIILYLEEKYPKGLKTLILEIKSCSAFMFEFYKKAKAPSLNHRLQLFHYLKSKSAEEGHIVYICKDDARLLEFGVFNPSFVEKAYREDIKKITYYYNKKELPPKEKFIVFDEEFGRFTTNWKVGYSQYLTKLYNFKNQKEFDDVWKPVAGKWNRAIKRKAEEKKITSANAEILAEIEKAGFDINFAVKKARGFL